MSETDDMHRDAAFEKLEVIVNAFGLGIDVAPHYNEWSGVTFSFFRLNGFFPKFFRSVGRISYFNDLEQLDIYWRKEAYPIINMAVMKYVQKSYNSSPLLVLAKGFYTYPNIDSIA
ncbi:hypothetical protein HQ533_05825 [Candidatus Woesearchaeota archaeon]|nr:hypothetical protein [Candidatus Woesearchaeota archaeon]